MGAVSVGVGAKPPHHKSKAISCCVKMCQCHGFEERLVAEEQVVQWAEDEEGPVPTRHGEQGFHDICGPVTCFTTARWECQLQHHGCVAHGEDEYIAVCKLCVALQAKYGGIARLQICREVTRDKVISVAPHRALKRRVVEAELARVWARKHVTPVSKRVEPTLRRT